MQQRQYRGLTKEGEWIYGWYKFHPYYEIHLILVFYENKQLDGGGYWREFEVIPETVEQQIGLKNKKRTEEYPEGQEIYQGDIVIGHPNLKKDETLPPLEVFWQGSAARFSVRNKFYVFGIITVPDGGMNYTWEVIGNIHQNPELMETNNAK